MNVLYKHEFFRLRNRSDQTAITQDIGTASVKIQMGGKNDIEIQKQYV